MTKSEKREREYIAKALVKKAKPKKYKDVGCPNSHLRVHLCLTPKQVKSIISSLRSSEAQRSLERDREYLKSIRKKFEEIKS